MSSPGSWCYSYRRRHECYALPSLEPCAQDANQESKCSGRRRRPLTRRRGSSAKLSSSSRCDWVTNWRRHEYAFRPRLSTLPPSDPRACSPYLLLLRGTPRPLPTQPVPVDSPHPRLLNSSSFPPTRNRNPTCNHLRKTNSRSLSAHGLRMLPNS